MNAIVSVAKNAGINWAKNQATKEQMILLSRAWGNSNLRESDFAEPDGTPHCRLVFAACHPDHVGSHDMGTFWEQQLDTPHPDASELRDFVAGALEAIDEIRKGKKVQREFQRAIELASLRNDALHSFGEGELWAIADEDDCIVKAGECETEAPQAIVFQTFEGAAEGCIEHLNHWEMNCHPVRLK